MVGLRLMAKVKFTLPALSELPTTDYGPFTYLKSPDGWSLSICSVASVV